MNKSLLGYHALALLVVAFWGVTFVSTKILIAAGLLPAQIFAIRFALAYAGIWAFCLFRKGQASRLFAGSLLDEAIDLYNDLRDKANAKPEGGKKAYYNGLRKELLEKTDALYDKLSQLVKAGAKA